MSVRGWSASSTTCARVLSSSCSSSRSSGPARPACGRTTTSRVARSGRSRARRTSPGPHTAAKTWAPLPVHAAGLAGAGLRAAARRPPWPSVHRRDKTTNRHCSHHCTTNNKNGRGHPMKRPLQGERNQGGAP
eukprot:scaffold6706_cov119-Isochrysis_galbana.AAC.6